jgi:hypothetical protein
MVLSRSSGRVLTVLLLSAALGGCNDAGEFSWFGSRNKQPPPPPQPQPLPERDVIRADTVGSVALVGDAAPRELRGFGLVVGLEGTGSRDCAASIRTYLVDRLQKLMASERWYADARQISVSALIDSPDTAVVELTGYVVPGAPRGARFDVIVTAATGTQTRSLEGGLLLPSELKIFGVSGGGRGIIAGRTVAFARGPVFTHPFASDAVSGESDPRRGAVLGGGVTLEARPARLILKDASYPMARRIEQRLNERFGVRPAVAEAMSQSYLLLHTPPAYHWNPSELIDLSAYVYLQNAPAYFEAKLRELSEVAARPQADYAALTRAWQGIGRVAQSSIQPLYGSDRAGLAFAAARAGLRLGDVTAAAVVGQMAASPRHPHRLEAVRELGAAAPMPAAATQLLTLINDFDPDVRIAAYEGLLRHRHPAVVSRSFAHRLDPEQINLTLDRAPSEAPPFIYVRRTRAPRIALIGSTIPVHRPLFFRHPNNRLLLNANPADETILLRVQILVDGPWERFQVNPTVGDLITTLAARPTRGEGGRPRGAGLPYAQVVQVLTALSRDGLIPAPVVFERESLTDLLGPIDEGERREAEEQSLDDFEAARGDRALEPADMVAPPEPDLPEGPDLDNMRPE